MNKIQQSFENIKSSLYDHPKLRKTLDWTWKLLFLTLSCIVYAYGFRAFIAPTTGCVEVWLGVSNPPEYHIISGGAGGLSQCVIRTIKIFANISQYEQYFQSALYLIINIPLFLFAFFKISKKFALLTLLDVALSSLFVSLIPDEFIYKVIDKFIYNDFLIRCICGGVTSGISSGVAMLVGTSAGGADVISIYFSEKRSVNAGKYIVMINFGILLFYTIVSIIGVNVNPSFNTAKVSQLVSLAIYSIIYFVATALVVDLINSRNKKEEIQIITGEIDLSQDLIHAFPHACTIVEGKGAFSNEEKYVLYMVISKLESKKVINFIKAKDPKAFVSIYKINQVYGRFYIKPIE